MSLRRIQRKETGGLSALPSPAYADEFKKSLIEEAKGSDRMKLRVVSWNVAYRTGDVAAEQGRLLARLSPEPDLVLLQEVNPNSLPLLLGEAGLGWCRSAVDLRTPSPDDTPVRRRGVSVAGRGPLPLASRLLLELPLPERALVCEIPIGSQESLTVASYHAPPGVNWHEKKPQQAVRFADWLRTVTAPALLGIDANTPKVDAIDLADTRTHWHTGDRKLHGEPGDDLLVGPGRVHALEDALRRWLSDHPDELERIRRERPSGPLALSHRTGRRKTHPGTDRRFDSIWISRHFQVESIDYLYDQSVTAGSDHAAVLVDLVL
jgi:endonuclease/exonuclease/phosphatase family metal-dependent hydrolase